MKAVYFYDMPIGRMMISADEDGITDVRLAEKYSFSEAEILQETPLIKQAAMQLKEYFSGARKEFDLPLAAQGTEFQKTVWAALRTIPYGETRSYKQIAVLVGNPNASRAIGMANHKNPILIFTPCHRVIGANGELVGFGAGLPTKEKLLAIEQK